MKVLYDHQIFGWQEYGGISRYFYELALEMRRQLNIEVNIVCASYINQYLAQDVNKDIVFGDLEYFNPTQVTIPIRLFSSAGFTTEKLYSGPIPAHPTLFLRKSVYERFGLFKPDYKIAGDFGFIARIFKNGDLKYVYVPRVLTRMQTGGVSSRGIKSTFLLNKEILRSCQENHIPTNFLKLLLRYPKKLLGYVYK